MEIYLPVLGMGVMLLFVLLLWRYDRRNLVKRALNDPEIVKKLYDVIQKENKRRRQNTPIARSVNRAEDDIKRRKDKLRDEIK